MHAVDASLSSILGSTAAGFCAVLLIGIIAAHLLPKANKWNLPSRAGKWILPVLRRDPGANQTPPPPQQTETKFQDDQVYDIAGSILVSKRLPFQGSFGCRVSG